MPGLGGNRANTESKQAATAASRSDPSTPIGQESPSLLRSQTARDGVSSAAVGNVARSATAQRPPGSSGPQHEAMSSLAELPLRSRAQPTLKASMLKKRVPTAAGMASTNTTGAVKKTSSGATRIGQGTPARATRYSLPVRAEKPVRTSKMTGKHVVLPSESQLAPLPGEEEDEDDEDDEDESSEDESDEEVASHADEEEDIPEEADEEAREQARQAARRRREEAQARLEALRKEKAAQRQARKPKGAPGYPDTKQRDASAARSGAGAFRGPAHARAPPRVPKSTGPVYHTFERLAPAARLHTPLPRLTSYAVAPAIHIPTLHGFLRREHSVKPRLYDECAYVVYFKPLLPGFGRALVRSSPEPRSNSPGAESRREREIVEREESGYVGSYFVANSKDDEGDIDDQGYIHGGEGQGQEDESTSDRNGRDRHSRKQSSQGGDVTETDGETERDVGRERLTGPSGAANSETETENERDPMLSISSRHANGGGDSEFETSRDTYFDGARGSHDRDASLQDFGDMDNSGMRTPRAIRPASPENGEDLAAEAEMLGDPALDLAKNEGELSTADVAGAQDLLHQQHLIELGSSDSQGLPEMRSANSDNEEKARHRSPTNKDDESGNGSRRHQRAREREERRRIRRERKMARMQGPNLASHNHDTSTNMLTSRSVLEALQVAELVILPYGVLVMYNFTAAEERDIIADVISSGCVRGGPALPPEDEETEAFHFCYDPSVPAPRIFNDFFTFRGPNHLLKLSLAHAIAQSTKLSVFEESMQRTLELTSHIPKELASSGELHLKRREALKLTGRLFKLRVDVNLTSNVLDTPELFWSEASLKALYDAIREYLEIDQRVENLNERLAVGNDLLEVIHDHLGSQSMDQITWIIIILIVVACIVACGEISARLVLHGRTRSDAAAAVTSALIDAGPGHLASPSPIQGAAPALAHGDVDMERMRQMYHMLLAAARAAAHNSASASAAAVAPNDAGATGGLLAASAGRFVVQQ